MITAKLVAFITGVLILNQVLAMGAGDAPANPLKIAVEDRLKPSDAGQVQFSGRLEGKLQNCIRNRILDQDVQALVTPYRAKSEIGDGDWRCEYWGKWFTALALADAYQPNSTAASVRENGCEELLKTAAPDGYLGTRQPQNRMQGWDVWGCKYALLGLMADYDRTGDRTVLAAACKHADVLINELGPGKTNIEDVGMWNGLPSSSVLEPIVQPGCTAKVNDGIISTPENFTNRWHSSVDTPHPHWVQIKLPRAEQIGSVVINFADPEGSAVDFKCFARLDGREREILRVNNNHERLVYRANFTPVMADTVRMVIESSANARYPNAAQVSEIQLFSSSAAGKVP